LDSDPQSQVLNIATPRVAHFLFLVEANAWGIGAAGIVMLKIYLPFYGNSTKEEAVNRITKLTSSSEKQLLLLYRYVDTISWLR
jgi:hypothetical protein